MIDVGSKLPKFELMSSSGRLVRNKDLIGKWVVIYFYPKDDTPGCTKEACNFRDSFAEYKKLGVEIYGVSADSVDSHKKFGEKYGLPFELLADVEKKLIMDCGVFKEKSMFGKKYFGIVRTTLVVNPDGEIAKVFPNVKVGDHDGDVLKFLRGKFL